MKRQVLFVLIAGVLLLAGCGEQNDKPQYEVTEPVIVVIS